jgi:phosphate transport system permease protein
MPDINQRNADWYIDKLVQYLVFLSGISAIVLIIGIFVFVTIEGFGFLLEDFSFREFFLSPWWEPTDEDEPTYGILALMAGTARFPSRSAARFTWPNLPPARRANFSRC